MKKALSLILSLLMLVSLLAMPVAADADDGFNDGQFGDWGDGSDPVDPPVEPDGPNGTKDYPYPVPKPASLPTEVPLAAGGSVYYQFPALKFANWTLIATGVTSVEVDGVVNDTLDPASRGIKTVLSADGNTIGFFNDTEEEVTVTLTLEQPVGTMEAPFVLEDGENAIAIPAEYMTSEYYMSYQTTAVGDYIFAFSDYENFEILLDVDGDPNDDSTRIAVTEDMALTTEDSYLTYYFIVRAIGNVGEMTVTMTPPAKGTASNPYSIFGYEGVVAGVNDLGDGLWPSSPVGVCYNLFGVEGATLVVGSEGPANLVINGTTYVVEGRLEIPMDPQDMGYFQMVFTTAEESFLKLDLLFPEGNYYNPKVLNKGKNTLPMAGADVTYYATYTAEKDGVLLVTPGSLTGLGYTDASAPGGYDYIFSGYLNDDGVIEGASEDFVLQIPVTAGDEVAFSVCVFEYEQDDEYYIPESVELYVGYEGENYATITTQPKTAYAKMGATVKTTVKATGDGLTYTWYFKNAGASKYTKSSIKTATYSTTVSSTTKGRQVYCVIKDKYGNTVTTNKVYLRESVSITTQPKTVYAKKGATIKTTVKASGDGLTYTWYFKNAGASKYTKSSIKTATYSTTMSSTTKNRQVYCVVKDKWGKTVTTSKVYLRESVSITTQPKTVTVAKNKTAKVSVKASGDGLTYTWYFKNAGASKFTKSSITSATYSAKMTSKVKGRQVYCVVKDKYGKTVKTVTVTLKMK